MLSAYAYILWRRLYDCWPAAPATPPNAQFSFSGLKRMGVAAFLYDTFDSSRWYVWGPSGLLRFKHWLGLIPKLYICTCTCTWKSSAVAQLKVWKMKKKVMKSGYCIFFFFFEFYSKSKGYMTKVIQICFIIAFCTEKASHLCGWSSRIYSAKR